MNSHRVLMRMEFGACPYDQPTRIPACLAMRIRCRCRAPDCVAEVPDTNQLTASNWLLSDVRLLLRPSAENDQNQPFLPGISQPAVSGKRSHSPLWYWTSQSPLSCLMFVMDNGAESVHKRAREPSFAPERLQDFDDWPKGGRKRKQQQQSHIHERERAAKNHNPDCRA